MNYFQYDDLINAYTDVAKDFDSNRVNSYFGPAAEAELDGFVGNIYTVPFTPSIPLIMQGLAIDICYYKMTYRSQNQKTLKDYIDARIKAIQMRQVNLVCSGGIVVQPFNQVFLSNSYGTSFGMDDPIYHRVDSGWQQSYQTDRGWPPLP